MTRTIIISLVAAALAAVATVLVSSAVAGAGAPRSAPIGTHPGTALLDAQGMSPADRHAAARTRSGKQLFVTRGPRSACVTDDQGSGHCAPASTLAAGGGFGGELCRADLPADQVRITGIVPPGASDVTLTDDVQTYAAQPTAGVVAFEVPRADVGDAVTVAWTAADGGRATVRVAQPAEVRTATC